MSHAHVENMLREAARTALASGIGLCAHESHYVHEGRHHCCILNTLIVANGGSAADVYLDLVVVVAPILGIGAEDAEAIGHGWDRVSHEFGGYVSSPYYEIGRRLFAEFSGEGLAS